MAAQNTAQATINSMAIRTRNHLPCYHVLKLQNIVTSPRDGEKICQ